VRSADAYERLDTIGQGQYGEVFSARCKLTGEVVALKKIRMDNEKEGFPITVRRSDCVSCLCSVGAALRWRCAALSALRWLRLAQRDLCVAH
jgi:serine/threonine protein kinase